MADTGWLKPAASTLANYLNTDGNSWNRVDGVATELVAGADTWLASGIGGAAGESSLTKYLVWDWVVPQGSYPGNAVVVGIEVEIYGYQYQHQYTDPDYQVAYTGFMLGGVSVLASGSSGEPDQQLFRIPDPDSFPDRTVTILPEHKRSFGGPTELFSLPAGTLVQNFIDQSSTTGEAGYLNAAVRCSMYAGVNPYAKEVGLYISHSRIKIHYEVSATQIDLEADPLLTLSLDADEATVIKRLESLVQMDFLIEQAALGGTVGLSAVPGITLNLPNDITNGLGFVDSTAFPLLQLGLDVSALEVIRHVDIAASPELELSITAYGAGTRTDLSAAPGITFNLFHEFENVLNLSSPPDINWLTLTIPTAVLVMQYNIAADPFLVFSLDAPNLEGSFNFAAECGTTGDMFCITFSIEADLGYSRFLEAQPTVFFTLGGVDNLSNMKDSLATPEIVFSIPRADLRSRYGEPAPDERTIFMCPVDRSIVLCRKDTSTL